eukprot:tig00000249_g22157.t1
MDQRQRAERRARMKADEERALEEEDEIRRRHQAALEVNLAIERDSVRPYKLAELSSCWRPLGLYEEAAFKPLYDNVTALQRRAGQMEHFGDNLFKCAEHFQRVRIRQQQAAAAAAAEAAEAAAEADGLLLLLGASAAACVAATACSSRGRTMPTTKRSAVSRPAPPLAAPAPPAPPRPAGPAPARRPRPAPPRPAPPAPPRPPRPAPPAPPAPPRPPPAPAPPRPARPPRPPAPAPPAGPRPRPAGRRPAGDGVLVSRPDDVCS